MTSPAPRAPAVLLLALAALLSLTRPAAAADEVPVGVWPLDPVPDVVAVFDPPDTPYGRGHRGVDLAGRVGQSVRAALPGTVSFAGSLAGRGVVVVDHGPTRTTYQPVTTGTTVGDAVAAGDVIGTLQSGGSHCAPATCLHWGWIEGGTYLDPLLLVGSGPVRLLPLLGLPAPEGSPSPSGPGAQRWQPLTEWWGATRPQALGWAWR